MDLKCSNCFAGTRVFKPFQLSKKCWKCQSIHHTDVAAQVCFDPPPLFSDRVHGITYPADPEEKADTDYEENYHYRYPQTPRVGGNRFYNYSLISVACWRCQTILCEPTGEEVRLSEACGLAPRFDISWFLSGDFSFLGPEGAKRFVPPGSLYLDVTCGACLKELRINGRSRLPVECWGCQHTVCLPTAGGGVRVVCGSVTAE